MCSYRNTNDWRVWELPAALVSGRSSFPLLYPEYGGEYVSCNGKMLNGHPGYLCLMIFLFICFRCVLFELYSISIRYLEFDHPGGGRISRPDVKANRFIYLECISDVIEPCPKECPFYHQKHHTMFSFNTLKMTSRSMPSIFISLFLVHIVIRCFLEPTAPAPGASSWHVWLLRTLNFDVFIRWRGSEHPRPRGWKVERFPGICFRWGMLQIPAF